MPLKSEIAETSDDSGLLTIQTGFEQPLALEVGEIEERDIVMHHTQFELGKMSEIEPVMSSRYSRQHSNGVVAAEHRRKEMTTGTS